MTSIAITADPNAVEDLYRRLKATPRVGSVMLKGAAIQGFRDTVMNNLLTMQAFNVVFACIIAFGVVYNTARVALSERGRELASLRVLGLTRGEISRILLGELALADGGRDPVGAVHRQPASGTRLLVHGHRTVPHSADYRAADVLVRDDGGAHCRYSVGTAGPKSVRPFGLDRRVEDARVKPEPEASARANASPIHELKTL